jgi:hypothetical protein
MSDVSPDYLMGCVSALTNLVALVAKELPREQREPIIDRIAQLQAAVELRWKDAPEKGPHAHDIGVHETCRMFLMVPLTRL